MSTFSVSTVPADGLALLVHGHLQAQYWPSSGYNIYGAGTSSVNGLWMGGMLAGNYINALF